MHVVVLDADPDFRALLSFLLQHEGHTVTEIATLDAVATVALVPLLVARPALHGDFLSRLRALIQQRQPRPTLVLTGGSQPEAFAAALGLPAADCLSLPLVPAALRARVAALATPGPGCS